MTKIIKRIEPLMKRLPVKKRVAAYARVSSGKDAMRHSLSAQVSYYSRIIQENKEWQYVGVYVDEAITGTKDLREDFQRMLKDCREGKIDMIITKSISRLARNTVTLLEVIRELKNLNIDVYFQEDNIHTLSGDGELMLSILASFYQEESLSTSNNCKWRIRKGFENAELINLRFMYGYRIKKGNVEIYEEEAKVVKMIFEDYLSGMGGTLIAKKLKNMGVKKLRGGTWTSERVLDILKNEKYTGNAWLQKKYVKDHLTKKLVFNKGDLPKYYAEGTHPAIIDLITFQKAKDIITRNRGLYSAKNKSANYPFTSKIVCGICGKKYRHKNRQGRVSWNCTTNLKFGKEACNSKQIPEDILYMITTEVLGISKFDEDYFEEMIKEINVPEPRVLIFIFNDGRSIRKEWNYKSRSESWSDEARQKARERNLKKVGGG